MVLRMRNLSPLRFVATALLVVVGAATSMADQRRDNGQMVRLVRPLSDEVGKSVAQVLIAGRPVSLATAVSEDGYLLTKRSELSGDPIRVRLADGRMFPARVAAVRRGNDLALLRIDGDVKLDPASFDTPAPGVASFLVSVGRAGRPIGIGVVGGPERKIANQGKLGIMFEQTNSRALVQGVWPESGADVAGVEPGDLIIAVNGHKEESTKGVMTILRGKYSGESVRLTIRRSNESRETDIIEIDAGIREFAMMQESENDSKVNGPRNQRLTGFDRVIQHDTVLDPYECGGPILDSAGNIVGLNIARAGRVVSYALPSDLVAAAVKSMLSEVRVTE